MRFKIVAALLILLMLSHYGWLLRQANQERQLRNQVLELQQDLLSLKQLERELSALRGLNSKLREGFGLSVADSSSQTRAGAALSWDAGSRWFSPPVRGRLSRGFQAGGWPGGLSHPGLDIACEAGEPVQAAAGGTVLFSGRTERYGELVLIQHQDGLVSGYGHLSRALPRPGERLARGALVGRVAKGPEGQGSHLHFSVQREGRPIDPVFVLEMDKQERPTG
jgi:murein DD-endopeptidase MepM/ murein hydrolase activator NlpD